MVVLPHHMVLHLPILTVLQLLHHTHHHLMSPMHHLLNRHTPKHHHPTLSNLPPRHLCIPNNLLHLTLSNPSTKNQLFLSNRLLTSLTRSSQYLTSQSSPIMALFVLAMISLATEHHRQATNLSFPTTEHPRQVTSLSLPAMVHHQAITLNLPAMEHHQATTLSLPAMERHLATTLSLPAMEHHQATTLSLPAMERHLVMSLIPPTHPTYNLLATALQNQSTEACLGVEEVSPHSLHTMRLLMAMANHPMVSLPTQHHTSHPRPIPPSHHQLNHLTLRTLLVELMFQWTESRTKVKFSFPKYLMLI